MMGLTTGSLGLSILSINFNLVKRYKETPDIHTVLSYTLTLGSEFYSLFTSILVLQSMILFILVHSTSVFRLRYK